MFLFITLCYLIPEFPAHMQHCDNNWHPETSLTHKNILESWGVRRGIPVAQSGRHKPLHMRHKPCESIVLCFNELIDLISFFFSKVVANIILIVKERKINDEGHHLTYMSPNHSTSINVVVWWLRITQDRQWSSRFKLYLGNDTSKPNIATLNWIGLWLISILEIHTQWLTRGLYISRLCNVASYTNRVAVVIILRRGKYSYSLKMHVCE